MSVQANQPHHGCRRFRRLSIPRSAQMLGSGFLLAGVLSASVIMETTLRAQTPAESLLRDSINLADGSIGQLHYDRSVLAQYGLPPATAATIVENSFRYHQGIWPATPVQIKYGLYIIDKQSGNGSMANTST